MKELEAIREKLWSAILDAMESYDFVDDKEVVLDAIMRLPEIEAGIGLYLASIEEREGG